MLRRTFLTIATALVASAISGAAPVQAAPETIRIDFTYYNPVSLLLKDKGWLEEEFKADGIGVEWVHSLGSNKALELLNSGSADFGSTAGAAALLGKINGNPIKSIYVYSKPEWTALVTRPGTGITRIEDLKGKRVAVARGTDPYIFLLRALDSVGLKESDIEVVLLQHPDGKNALVNGDVDAWSGLDPYIAQVEVDHTGELFYRDANKNTWGVLNVSEQFAKDNPEIVERVLAVYERARKYSIEHPDEVQAALIAAAKLTEPVAARQLGERTDLASAGAIGDEQKQSILAAGQVLQQAGVIKPDVDVAKTVDELIDPQYIERALKRLAAL
jgi:sulfonate transport system substrate-binding protein